MSQINTATRVGGFAPTISFLAMIGAIGAATSCGDFKADMERARDAEDERHKSAITELGWSSSAQNAPVQTPDAERAELAEAIEESGRSGAAIVELEKIERELESVRELQGDALNARLVSKTLADLDQRLSVVAEWLSQVREPGRERLASRHSAQRRVWKELKALATP